MIEYHSEIDFNLSSKQLYSEWIKRVVNAEGKNLSKLSYIFCSDEFLLDLNKKFLNHDTLTDIITFPYNENGALEAEIYISIPRVRENAIEREIEFEDELKRVMIHGVLHLLGYGDRTIEEQEEMRRMEDKYVKMFHVEQEGDV